MSCILAFYCTPNNVVQTVSRLTGCVKTSNVYCPAPAGVRYSHIFVNNCRTKMQANLAFILAPQPHRSVLPIVRCMHTEFSRKWFTAKLVGSIVKLCNPNSCIYKILRTTPFRYTSHPDERCVSRINWRQDPLETKERKNCGDLCYRGSFGKFKHKAN